MFRRGWRRGTPLFYCWLSLGAALLITGMLYHAVTEASAWCRQQAWLAFNRAVAVPAEVAAVPYAGEINRAARQNDVDPRLVAAVIAAESSFNSRAVSSRQAYGLMQIIPSTWEFVNSQAHVCQGRHSGPCRRECYFTPELNIRVGTWYLAHLYRHFQGDAIKAVAGYNAGPHQVERCAGPPPFAETQRYVDTVLTAWYHLSGAPLPLAWRWYERLLAWAGILPWLLAGETALLAAASVALYRRRRGWRWR